MNKQSRGKADAIIPQSESSHGRLLFLDGIKGIACIGILFSHFWGPYFYTDVNNPVSSFLARLFECYLPFVIDGRFWLCVFCVISGYLESTISKAKDIPYYILKRYLRFSLPLFFICILIYVLDVVVGFHNTQLSELLGNKDFLYFYTSKIGIEDIISYPIKGFISGSTIFGGPLWMLGFLFTAYLFIILHNYLILKFPSARIFITVGFLVYPLLRMGETGYIFFACLSGSVLKNYMNKFKFSVNKWVAFLLAVLLLSSINFRKIVIDYIQKFIAIPSINSEHLYLVSVLTALLIMVILKSPSIIRLFSVRPLTYLGNMSFYIYCFHWPVTLSISAIIFLKAYQSAGYSVSWVLALLSALLITIIISILYNRFIDPLCKKITAFILNWYENK